MSWKLWWQEMYLPFKEVDQKKLRAVSKKVNAVIRHIETDDVTQTNKLAMTAVFWLQKKLEWRKAKQERKKSHGGEEQLKVILPTWEGISTDWKEKDEEKLEGKEKKD